MRRALELICALLLLFSVYNPAYAVTFTVPSTLAIEQVHVFRYCLNATDKLYLLRYNVAWGNFSDQPYYSIDQTFNFLLYDSGGNLTGNKTAYAFHDLGYGKGVVAFYFSGIGNDTGPSWGDLGNITIAGNSLFGNSTPNVTYTLQASDYSSYTTASDIREELRQYIIAQAMFLDSDWNQFWLSQGMTDQQVALLQYFSDSQSYVFSGAGEAYFSNAIPDISSMCPSLFAFSLNEITYNAQTHPLTAKTTYESQWAGTPIQEFKDAVAGLMGGVGASTAFTMLTMLFIMGNMIVCNIKWGRAYPGIMVSWGSVLILTRMGFPDIAVVMTGIMGVVLLALYFLFYRTGQG